ncbi:MAG TPA: cytochrome c oxidase assembly protein [Pirellulales bacterium]|nr:cytochrome c oxidase assembly protein [Pirellulales bacterium]
MSATFEAFLRSWPSEPWLVAALVATAAVYLRGWLALRGREPERWHAGRLAAFLGGLASIFLALASPIEPFAGLLLQVHMLQHLLLMMVAPPLLWLGAPLFPLLRGLPHSIRREWAAPVLRAAWLRRWFARLTHPCVAIWPFVAATWGWHAPAAYEAALARSAWHYLEHFCFLATALLFWYPVVRPYPSRPRWSRWLLFPYLIAADLQNTVLSALLAFSGQVWYPHYEQVPRVTDTSALADQAAAGALMWVPGSLVYLGPLFAIAVGQLFGAAEKPARGRTRLYSARLRMRRALVVGRPSRPPAIDGLEGRPTCRPSVSLAPACGIAIAAPRHRAQPKPSAAAFDLLRVPLVGRFLRWPHGRRTLQALTLLLAAAVIYDGLRGPEFGPMNLAGVLPWIHWRGLLAIGLVAAGNLGCMACPFTLPRRLGRRWLPAGWNWPRWLRGKWLAIGLLAIFFWTYEEFGLWDHPGRTAWIAAAYFAAAFAIDGLFRGASFCKHLCPIGQFNFVQSLVSPLEVKVREAEVCASCRTKECIRGAASTPGCELQLLVPRKSSNMDCTFCLDCVHACPHANVGILAVAPGHALWRPSPHDGLGRSAGRNDRAALCLVLTFGAFSNAAGMTAPVVDALDRLRSFVGPLAASYVTLGFYLAALILAPAILIGSAAALGGGGSGPSGWLKSARRYSYALVPLGFGMWLAHYSFHFFTSYDAAVPVAQRFLGDLGLTIAGEPRWVCGCCRPAADWLLHAELLSLDFGLLASLYASYRIAASESTSVVKTLRTAAPWAALISLLFFAGIWILLQPMDMRGTMPPG